MYVYTWLVFTAGRPAAPADGRMGKAACFCFLLKQEKPSRPLNLQSFRVFTQFNRFLLFVWSPVSVHVSVSVIVPAASLWRLHWETRSPLIFLHCTFTLKHLHRLSRCCKGKDAVHHVSVPGCSPNSQLSSLNRGFFYIVGRKCLANSFNFQIFAIFWNTVRILGSKVISAHYTDLRGSGKINIKKRKLKFLEIAVSE